MVRISKIIAVLGLVVRAFGSIVILPAIAAALYQEWQTLGHFALTSALSYIIGSLAMKLNPEANMDDLERLEGVAVVALGWFFVAVFGAIPYWCCNLSIIDGLFESMSGFTTTGATIFTDFSAYTDSLFFYRGLTQWLGGVGILVLFVAILPHLAVAGRQLFFAETSAASKEKLTPRIRDTARRLWGWYLFLTLMQILLLILTGMPVNDSIANSFATMAAGGFSPNAESIMGYKSPVAEWIIILFMFLAGANFTLQVKTALRGNAKELIENSELRTYCLIVFLSTAALFTVFAYDQSHGFNLTSLRSSIFQNLSILTTTGFATEDFNLWAAQAKAVLIVLMFIGGCSGSAGGGIKVIRFMFLINMIRKGIRRAIYPKAVLLVRVGKRVFESVEIQPIISFILLYFLLYGTAGTVVSIIENDLVIGFTGAIVTLGNIGPGFGTIGPMGNFADLHAISKMIFFFLMWAGRLEIMTLFIFCKPEVWRYSKWK